MITTLQVYLLCVFITFTILYTNYLTNIQIMTVEDDVQKLLQNKLILFILLFIISILWFIILPATILSEVSTTKRGGNK